ncbi:hypothetical protein, partial [Victivallis vadensis]|uniref:hypothetical protein n=1 Tax=Victivallis vadensis TaxID=172901 RepID=UPI00307E0BD6
HPEPSSFNFFFSYGMAVESGLNLSMGCRTGTSPAKAVVRFRLPTVRRFPEFSENKRPGT